MAPQWNGAIVEIVQADAKGNGRWIVRLASGGDKSVSVSADKMEQLRPLK